MQGQLYWEDPRVDSVDKVAGHLQDIAEGSVSAQVRRRPWRWRGLDARAVAQREGWLGAPGRSWLKMSRVHAAVPWAAVVLLLVALVL